MLQTRPIPKLFTKHPHYKHHSKKKPHNYYKICKYLVVISPILSSSAQLDALHNQQACCCSALLGSLTFLAISNNGIVFHYNCFSSFRTIFSPSSLLQFFHLELPWRIEDLLPNEKPFNEIFSSRFLMGKERKIPIMLQQVLAQDAVQQHRLLQKQGS